MAAFKGISNIFIESIQKSRKDDENTIIERKTVVAL